MTGGLQGMNGRSRSEKRLEDQQTNTKMIYYGDTKAVVLNLLFQRGRTMVQVQVSRAARMSFTYYVINTTQPDL